jgi:hypothetical protein
MYRGILVRRWVRIQRMFSDRYSHLLSGGGVLHKYKFCWLNWVKTVVLVFVFQTWRTRAPCNVIFDWLHCDIHWPYEWPNKESSLVRQTHTPATCRYVFLRWLNTKVRCRVHTTDPLSGSQHNSTVYTIAPNSRLWPPFQTPFVFRHCDTNFACLFLPPTYIIPTHALALQYLFQLLQVGNRYCTESEEVMRFKFILYLKLSRKILQITDRWNYFLA